MSALLGVRLIEVSLYFKIFFPGGIELLTAKFIFINRLQYVFQGRNLILVLSIRSGVRLIEVINEYKLAKLF